MNNITRAKRLVKNLATAKTHKEAIIAAGYSEKTASKQGIRTVNGAIDLVAKRALQGNETAQNILSLVGMSSEEVASRLRYLALESKNDGVSLQAIKPFARAIGVNYDEETTVNAPQLNITVEQNTAQPSHETGATDV